MTSPPYEVIHLQRIYVTDEEAALLIACVRHEVRRILRRVRKFVTISEEDLTIERKLDMLSDLIDVLPRKARKPHETVTNEIRKGWTPHEHPAQSTFYSTRSKLLRKSAVSSSHPARRETP